VWIVDTADSPATAPEYFPLVNGSATDFCHPFGMTMPRYSDPARSLFPQIKVRHLTATRCGCPTASSGAR
jgi:hypothetical protein